MQLHMHLTMFLFFFKSPLPSILNFLKYFYFISNMDLHYFRYYHVTVLNRTFLNPEMKSSSHKLLQTSNLQTINISLYWAVFILRRFQWDRSTSPCKSILGDLSEGKDGKNH